MEITQKRIRRNLKRQMKDKNINLKDISVKTNINIVKLIYLLYCPFSRFKLSSSIKICKALKINTSDILN